MHWVGRRRPDALSQIRWRLESQYKHPIEDALQAGSSGKNLPK
jgi:hypothetical protein